jgi:hypothetical protein
MKDHIKFTTESGEYTIFLPKNQAQIAVNNNDSKVTISVVTDAESIPWKIKESIECIVYQLKNNN